MHETQLIPFDRLLEVYRLIFHHYEGAPRRTSSQPTDESRRRIEDELGVTLPDSFVELASSCPFYDLVWFADIGEDYASRRHILRLNQDFRAAGLASKTVIFNHGYDGDCDCWDVSRPSDVMEHPIVYVGLDFDLKRASKPRPLATTFHEYLEDFCRFQVRTIRSRRRKRRARDLLGIPRQSSKGAESS